MTKVSKNDVNQIFGVNAPDQDKPPYFNNYTTGWGEARANNGKPTIRGFNFLQQRTDQNLLWIHQNGGALPYDESIDYVDGVIALKDGRICKLVSGVWLDVLKSENPTAMPPYYDSSVTYQVGSRIMLDDNSGFVVSTIANNINNPNSNITGWITSFDSDVRPHLNHAVSLDDLLKLSPSNHDLVTLAYRNTDKETYFSGSFIYIKDSTATENNGTIFAPNSGVGRWFRLYGGAVNALWFGLPDGVNDQTILNPAIQCAIDNKRAVDFSGSTWGISSEIKMHSAVTVISGIENKITVKQGAYTNGYAVEIGDPSQGWMGGRSTLTCNGALWTECQSRDFKLNGFYIKGSFHKIDSIRAVGFNGTGCRLDAFHDSQIGRISVELCGNEDNYAFDCSSLDDTCNAFSIESLQVEQAYQRGIKFTETIRATVNNIHAERLITTNSNPTTDNPLGYDLNHIFNTANSTFNQAILDSTDTDLYARIDGVLCSYTNFYVDSGNVYGSFGENTTYTGLFAKSFLQYGDYKQITFIDPNVTTMTLTNTAIVHNPEVVTMVFGYQAKSINIYGGNITNYGGGNTSDVAMGNINAYGTEIGNVYKTGIGDGYCSGLSHCKITNFYGNWDNIIKVFGGTIQNADLSTRSMAVFDGVSFGDFKANGDFKYTTRNCTASGTVTWSVPTALTTQLGALTERIGYLADGKIYQYDGKSWSKLV